MVHYTNMVRMCSFVIVCIVLTYTRNVFASIIFVQEKLLVWIVFKVYFYTYCFADICLWYNLVPNLMNMAILEVIVFLWMKEIFCIQV